jgi:hypothetical protein
LLRCVVPNELTGLISGILIELRLLVIRAAPLGRLWGRLLPGFGFLAQLLGNNQDQECENDDQDQLG